MNRENKIKLAIERGYTCNPLSGKVYGFRGNELTTKSTQGYLFFAPKKDNKRYMIKHHQFIWYWVNKEIVDCIDHINGVRDDNRIENLRSVTNQQNCFNKKETKGYYLNKKNGKYKAVIMLNGKIKHIGLFNTEQEAHQAYSDAKKIHHII